MKKHYTLLLLPLLLGSFLLRAQNSTLTGRVLDQQDNAPLPGAHLQLQPLPDGEAGTAVTDKNGEFSFEELRPGSYLLTTTFLGYQPQKLELTLPPGVLELEPIRLQTGSLDLEEVEVKERVLPAVQKGDTTEYNSDAFKTNPDANAEDLIRKMPGVVVEDGQVQAQGEEVKEVLVDGKPFFTNDPRAALRNLPADLIEKVQVYDRESDQAQFTGIRDTETSKTLNIITRSNMRNGQFGKAYAGYGTEERYRAGGQISYFDGDSRLSLIGQTNNINQQNFASEDLLGVLGSSGRRGRGGRGGRGRGGRSFGGGSTRDFLVNEQNGIAQTHALGLNYNDQWGNKTKISGNYFFNFTDNEAQQILSQEFLNGRISSPLYNENSLTINQNTNHRFNARIEHQIDSSNSIIFTPRVSAQLNDGDELTLGENLIGDLPLSISDYKFSPELAALDLSGRLLLRHKFARKGRTLSLRLEGGYTENEGESILHSEIRSFDLQPGVDTDTLDQFSDLLSEGIELGANLTYTEPAGENAIVSLTYSADYEEGDSDQKTFDFSENSQAYDQLNPLLSNTFKTRYQAHRAGLGYQYRGDKLIVNSRLYFQYAELQNDQEFPTDLSLQKTFRNVLPSAFLRYQFSRQENIRLAYRSRTRAPSVDQLQEVVDNSNPLQLSTGNPNLKQAFENRFFLRYSKTNLRNAQVFYALLGGSITDNYIGNSTFVARADTVLPSGISLQRGGRLNRPVNLDGAWNIRSFLTYGLPVGFIRSNINFNLLGSFVREPGLLNEEKIFSNTTTAGLGITLSSNISEKVDFRISSRSNFNWVDNSLDRSLDNNFFNQTTDLVVNWIFGPGIVFRTNLSHQYFSGLSDEVDSNFLLWNMGLAKKIFKNERGEIQVSVFDILRQNTNVQRSVTEVLVEDVQTEVLQQYVMLTFTYQLRNFKTQ